MTQMWRLEKEPDAAYRVDRYDGIAWRFIEPETQPDDDTEWTGIEQPTGNAVMVMVGDDRKFSFDPSEVHKLKRSEYCGECGQIGCGGDGYTEDND